MPNIKKIVIRMPDGDALVIHTTIEQAPEIIAGAFAAAGIKDEKTLQHYVDLAIKRLQDTTTPVKPIPVYY